MVHGRFSIYFSYKNEIRPLICWKASPLPTGKLLCRDMETFLSQEKDDLKKKKNEFHPLGIWLFFSHRTSWLILGKKLKLRPPYFRDAFMACSCWLGTYKKKKKATSSHRVALGQVLRLSEPQSPPWKMGIWGSWLLALFWYSF